MALSTKNYNAVAAILKDSVDDFRGETGAHAAVIQVATDIGKYFEKENPRFDLQRFLRASGL